MELSEEAKQSYMEFCKVSPESKLSNDFVRVEVSYDPIENDDDGSTGPEDTSLTPETEEIDTYYRVPENFRLEDGLDSTKMEEIKEYNSSKTR